MRLRVETLPSCAGLTRASILFAKMMQCDERCHTLAHVIAGPPRSGVTRQSIRLRKLSRLMDRRVKPGDDDGDRVSDPWSKHACTPHSGTLETSINVTDI
jgi:hypothetical protein